jgi:hypothetical protein
MPCIAARRRVTPATRAFTSPTSSCHLGDEVVLLRVRGEHEGWDEVMPGGVALWIRFAHAFEPGLAGVDERLRARTRPSSLLRGTRV